MNDKFFFIKKAGTRITPEFDAAFDFHEDLAVVFVGKNGRSRRAELVALSRDQPRIRIRWEPHCGAPCVFDAGLSARVDSACMDDLAA